MDTQVYEFSITELQDTCNNAFAEAIRGLEGEGLLKSSAEDILNRYAIVLHRQGTLGHIWDKILGHRDSKATRYRLVKIVDSEQ